MILTKSKYILGLECPRALWSLVNNPGNVSDISVSSRFIIEEGERVGVLARTLFPEGVLISVDDYNMNIVKTKELLSQKKILFEAGIQSGKCYARADILVPAESNSWDLIEVKASTKVKDVNIHDIAFQKYVYQNSGVNIRKCILMYVNKEYFRDGDLDPNRLFVQDDITLLVNKELLGIEESISHLLKIVNSKTTPEAGIFSNSLIKDGYHDCVSDGCLALPENNVFCFSRAGKVARELYHDGIIHMKDVPSHVKLNDKQKIQRDCVITNKPYVNANELQTFLRSIVYPIHYLDFETFSTAIPQFEKTRPYSQIPFQFSLHTQEDNGSMKHYSFLYDGTGDPRREFLQALKENVGREGTIMVYNQSFEMSRLKELAQVFPEEQEWIMNIIGRMSDLLKPFRDFHYYHPSQQGSASIKSVLPSIVGITYDGMNISDGGTASACFYNTTYRSSSEEQKRKVRQDLLKYCEQDTLAEVMIIKKLEELTRPISITNKN